GMQDASLSLHLKVLSTHAGKLMDHIQLMGDAIPHGTPLGDAMLRLMDHVLEMDSTIDATQRAVAYLATHRNRSRLSTEEYTELLQARRDRRKWEEEKQMMERKLAESEQKAKNLQELNSMLMERARPSTPSSGFCSASHSPRSIEEHEDGNEPPVNAAAAGEKGKDKEKKGKKEEEQPRSLVPPPKPVRTHSMKVLTLDYTPEFDSATFKDSIQFNVKKVQSADLFTKLPVMDVVDLDDTVVLSTEDSNDGPMCSTFKEGMGERLVANSNPSPRYSRERSIYHTPVTSKKNKARRRSSSLGDVMKKIFTPKNRVKNPILEGKLD
ncbi:hypothetical protein PMAYCL1PPCAC_07656, partial [Pristionchus mayeri]